MGDFNWELMSKGITKAIKNYGDIQAQDSKLKASIAINQIEKKSNFLYKMQEQAQSQQIKNRLTKQMFQEMGGQPGQDITPGADVFAQQPGPQLRMGREGGYDIHYPKAKDFIFSRIQAKKQRNMPLTEKEQKFESEYLGTSKGVPTDWDIRKEARATVNALLQNNKKLQFQAIKNPELIPNLMIREEQRIRRRLQDPSQGIDLPTELPPEVKTTSQALKYLMDNYGASREASIEHLKSLISGQTRNDAIPGISQ